METILNDINTQCDDLIHNYIDTTATNALKQSTAAQESLYTVYQTVRKSYNNNNNNKGNTKKGATQQMDVIDYTNLLISQTNAKPIESKISNSITSTSKSNPTTPNTKTTTKIATGKKLLRGFGNL